MSDYIKREDAIKIINSGISIDTYADKRYVNGLFRAIRPADVAPVRHGRWIFNGEGMSLTCSDCGVKYNIDDADGGLDFMENAKYCISCGTRMDEEKDDA